MPRYIEIEQKKLKELTKQVQLFQDDIVCGIGTDFMQKIATAENKLLFDIVKGLATELTADVVPISEVEKAKQEVARKLIAEFKDLVLRYVQDRDLLLVVFKNAVNYAETELKKKYIGETK